MDEQIAANSEDIDSIKGDLSIPVSVTSPLKSMQFGINGAGVKFARFREDVSTSTVLMVTEDEIRYADDTTGAALWRSDNWLCDRGAIPENTAVNNLVKAGMYKVSNWSANSITGLPANSYAWGVLLVFTAGNSTAQIYVTDDSDYSTYVRARYMPTNAWRAWRKLSTVAL